MPGLLADVNVEGHLAMLMQRVEGPTWREVWAALDVEVVTFASLGLARDVSDATLWQECQRRQVILVTGNRNAEGPDSLEATIRTFNTPARLPVLTLADPPRVFRDRDYAESVVERLLELLIDLDQFRGVGRVYLP